jgi:hypothetical protein
MILLERSFVTGRMLLGLCRLQPPPTSSDFGVALAVYHAPIAAVVNDSASVCGFEYEYK